MHVGMNHLLEREKKAEYLLIVNDDVQFFDGTIERLVGCSLEKSDAIVVGATCDDHQKQTYGAVKYLDGFRIKYRMVQIGEEILCDTFNANCVLIPYNLFEKTGTMDSHYVHSLGDFDYGLSLKKVDGRIYSSDFYVGICNRNSIIGTWLDKSLPLKKRLQLKETAKGAPAKQWFYFLKKNFGTGQAVIFTITPYIKLLLGR